MERQIKYSLALHMRRCEKSAGFDLESYVYAGFSVSKFLNDLCCYIYYLHKGIEICKLPKHSYDHLVKAHDLTDIMMERLQSIEGFQIQLL